MIIEHDSQNVFYRAPFGAVKTGEKVKLRLSLENEKTPEIIRLITTFGEQKKEHPLKYLMRLGNLNIYECEIEVPEEPGLLWYYFEVSTDGKHLFYGNNSAMLGGMGKSYAEKPLPYQITVYKKNYKTPEWFSGSVMYQIFPDRFFNGNENGEFSGERTDIIKREWGDTPFYKPEQFGGEYLANDFFGGNLMGIEKKLPYLAELGVDVIYLNPIFKAYSNHKYDTGNYKEIDENFGTEADFISLTKAAKKHGIRIILDGVFNHTGSDSIYFNKKGRYAGVGAYQSTDSEFSDWFCFEKWPDKYDSWWGIDTLPALNEQSESLREYLLEDDDAVVKYWLKRGASGWRLDVVDELPDDFVKILRREVKKQNPDAVIIGEVWEDASNKESYGVRREYLLGDELDSVMNYPFRNALIDFATGNIDAKMFDARIMSIKENYPKECYNILMNFLSTHDVERIITMVSSAPKNGVDKDFQANFRLSDAEKAKAIEKVKQLVIFQMLMPGVPSIYYGDETGLEGYRDPFCRMTFDWEKTDCELSRWYKKVIGIKKSSTAFANGEFENVYKYEQGYGFIRYDRDAKHIVLANFSDEHRCFRLDLARYDISKLTGELYDENYTSDDGIFYLEMPGNSVKVLESI